MVTSLSILQDAGSFLAYNSPAGKELGRFGDLVDVSEGFPGRRVDGPEKLRVPLGRVHLCPGLDGSVFVVFQFMPIVQKYSQSGKLIWQTRLEGDPVVEMTQSFWNEPGAPPRRGTKKMDGVPFNLYITAACRTGRGNVAVVFANKVLAIVSPEGKHLATLLPGSANVGCVSWCCCFGRSPCFCEWPRVYSVFLASVLSSGGT